MHSMTTTANETPGDVRGHRFLQLQEHREKVYNKKLEILQEFIDDVSERAEAAMRHGEDVHQKWKRKSDREIIRTEKRQNLWVPLLCLAVTGRLFSLAFRKKRALARLNVLLLPLLHRYRMRINQNKAIRLRFEASVSQMQLPTVAELKEKAFFQMMPDAMIEDVIRAFTPTCFIHGQIIVYGGEEGDAMYLIESGKVDVLVKQGKKQTSILLATLSRGSIFGEWALLTGEARTATCLCSQDATCWKITAENFRRAISMGEAHTRRRLLQTGLERRCQNLAKLQPLQQEQLVFHPMFRVFSSSQLADAISSFRPVAFYEGDELFKEGDVGDSLYLIVTGKVKIKQIRNGESVELLTLGPGSLFGEFACIFIEPRSASAACITNSDMWMLTKHNLMEMLSRNAKLFLDVRAASNILRAGWVEPLTNEEILRLQFIEKYIPPVRENVVNALRKFITARVFGNSEIVLPRRQVLNAVIFIVKGRLQSNSGQCFQAKEMLYQELIFSEPPISELSYQAKGKVELWQLQFSDIHSCIQSLPFSTQEEWDEYNSEREKERFLNYRTAVHDRTKGGVIEDHKPKKKKRVHHAKVVPLKADEEGGEAIQQIIETSLPAIVEHHTTYPLALSALRASYPAAMRHTKSRDGALAVSLRVGLPSLPSSRMNSRLDKNYGPTIVGGIASPISLPVVVESFRNTQTHTPLSLADIVNI